MSWIMVGTMAVTGAMNAMGTDRSLRRQEDELESKREAYRKQAIENRNSFETRYYQTENMHSDKLEALEKEKTYNTGKVAGAMGGSGASAGTGTTAHVVASENARGQFALNSYKKKADFELENIREKGENEQNRFNSMADEVEEQRSYIAHNRSSMITESFFGGAMGGASAGSTFRSIYKS